MKKIICIIICFYLTYVSFGQSLTLSDTTIIKKTSFCTVCFKIEYSNEYIISWHNDAISNVSSKPFPLINGELLTVLDTLESYVVLYQNCGQKAKCVVLLPLYKHSPEMIFENVIGYDTLNKVLLFISNEYDGKTINVTLFNLVTEEKEDYQLPKPCSAVNPIECIDDIKYREGQVTISYYGNENSTIHVKEIRLSNEKKDF